MLSLRKITQTSLFHATKHVILIGDWCCQYRYQCQRKFIIYVAHIHETCNALAGGARRCNVFNMNVASSACVTIVPLFASRVAEYVVWLLTCNVNIMCVSSWRNTGDGKLGEVEESVWRKAGRAIDSYLQTGISLQRLVSLSLAAPPLFSCQRPFNLRDGQAAPSNSEVYQWLGPRRRDIWPRFSIPVDFKALWFPNGATYLKSQNCSGDVNDMLSILTGKFCVPLIFIGDLNKCNIWPFRPSDFWFQICKTNL